jgi:hypothetical protein
VLAPVPRETSAAEYRIFKAAEIGQHRAFLRSVSIRAMDLVEVDVIGASV